jgi:hypothetical protein
LVSSSGTCCVGDAFKHKGEVASISSCGVDGEVALWN